MPRIDDEDKRQRLERIHLLLARNARGVTEAEIADEINLERRTVNNYLRELEYQGKALKDGLYWFPLVLRESRLRSFDLSPEEAVTLYLGARLLSKQQDKRNEPAETALLKLASVLKADAGIGAEIEQAARELAQRPTQKGYQPVFRDVVRGYIYRKKIEITYRPLNWNEAFQTTFSTYLLEPSPIGFTTYLVGHSSIVNDRRAYKLERIESVRLTKEDYFLPPDFPGLDILRNAWSIVMGEETLRVVLRFGPAVKARVLETRWHPSQGYEEEPDGKLRWWVDVADTTDIKPWIRSWGSDVEVVGPEELRESIKSHIQKSAQTYTLTTGPNSTLSRLLRLWGKTTKETNVFHPALYHMLDVAHIAQQLLRSRATRRWRRVLGAVLCADAESLYEWLPYLIALHDIGKLSVPFQFLNEKQVMRLKEEGFDFGKADRKVSQVLHHTIVGRILLDDSSFTKNWPDHLRLAFMEMVSGHHGFYEAEGMNDERRLKAINEPPEWQTLRQTAIQWLESYLCLQWPNPLPNPANVSAAVAALNGFCILCDWLGSDQDYFTAKPHTLLSEYMLHSRKKAFDRVKDAGFFQNAVSQAPTTFANLFAFPPRPLQAAIDHIPNALLANPTLTIIEAPTGEGKTEAALTLARRIAALRGSDEMYIALPTTATSNAMYERITRYLEQQLGLDPELVRLVHGQSFLLEDDLSVNSLSNGDGERSPAMDWFAPKKKALLAPLGVGTIDQAELSTLNVRHNALRLIGLAGKVIILDEVHAYDTYMTTIIKRTLEWLSALGSSVILLSATLPTRKRQELAAAFAGDVASQITHQKDYPNLITIGRSVYSPSEAIGVYQPDKKISVSPLQLNDEQAVEKAEWLLEKVKQRGCVCWITNTVDRAQKIFEALQNLKPDDVKMTLLHGRFPQEDRAKLETEILAQYSNGENVTRPQKGIVVGTQVLEQSLDLDFDVMATDLAPIDLILQRAGRLHRHPRAEAERYNHTAPHLYINTITTNADNGIYGEYILQMTANTLQTQLENQTPIILPAAYRPLVEAVYTTDKPEKDDPLYDAWKIMYNKANELEENADQRLANSPKPDDFYSSNKFQFQEDEDSSAWMVAQTRWGQKSLTVIPLMRVDNTVVPVLSPDLTPIPLDQPADRHIQLRLRQRSIRISNHGLVKVLKKQQAEETHKLFTQSALLKSCVPLWLEPVKDAPQVFANDNLQNPVYLHPVMGLVFGKYEGRTIG